VSYWASVYQKMDVSGRDQIQFMLMGEVDKGCPNKECSDSREMQGLPVGAFVEGELHLPWINVSKPIHAFYSLLLFLQEANQGTLPWCGGQWWQCYPQVLSQK
jgi:hypothetical protein